MESQVDEVTGEKGGGSAPRPVTILDDKKYRRQHARTVVRMLQLGVLKEEEVIPIIRAAAYLAADAALRKHARDFRSCTSILIQCANLEQTELAAVEKLDVPDAFIQNNQVNNFNLSALSLEQLEQLAALQERMLAPTNGQVAKNGTAEHSAGCSEEGNG